MEVILANLFSAVAGGLVGGGAVVAILRIYAESRIRVSAEKELNRFKHQLDASAAAASFDYSRRLREYDLFIARKHRALARLHELVLDAVSQIVRYARNERDVPLIRDMSRADVEEFLQQHAVYQFPKGKRDDILERWDLDRDAAYVEVLGHIIAMQPEYARRAWVKANNYRLKTSLYLPDLAESAAAALLKTVRHLLEDTDPASPVNDDRRERCRSIEEEFARLRDMMRREASRADAADV